MMKKHVKPRNDLLHVIALGLFLICFTTATQATAEEETLFVTVHLPHGIKVEIPRAWRIVAGDAQEALETGGAKDIDLSHMPIPDNNILLRANATPADRPAWMSVAFLSKALLTPTQAAELSSSGLKDYDRELHQKVENFLHGQGMELVEWRETRKDFLKDRVTLVSEYRRRGQGTPVMWEQINTIPLDAGTMTLTVSYNEKAGPPWRSVVMRIRSSCRVDGKSSP